MMIPTLQKGNLLVIRIQENDDGTWEKDWEPLRETPMASLMSRMTQRELDHALHGYSRPFVDALGISPEGALRKIPSQECSKRGNCTFYDPTLCVVSSKELPWCYEPDGIAEQSGQAGAQAVFHWRSKVYLVVVRQHG